MNNIDLNYINAKWLTLCLSRKLTPETVNELVDIIDDLVSDDYSRAQGYIRKYDNKYDLAQGTNVGPLKEELRIYSINILLIKEALLKLTKDVKE